MLDCSVRFRYHSGTNLHERDMKLRIVSIPKHVLIFTGLLFLLAGCSSDGAPSSNKEIELDSASLIEPKTIDEIYGGFKWKYRKVLDEMSGKLIKMAMVYTEKTFMLFNSPYEEHRGSLTVRDHPRYGRGVMINVGDGILVGDYVSARFDDGPVKRYEIARPESRTGHMVFIRNHSTFLKNLRKSDTLRVEVRFYNDHTVVLKFNTTELKM